MNREMTVSVTVPIDTTSPAVVMLENGELILQSVEAISLTAGNFAFSAEATKAYMLAVMGSAMASTALISYL
jgi:hypothetical protein